MLLKNPKIWMAGAMLLAGFAHHEAAGATYEWNGASEDNNRWGTGDNWVGGTAPSGAGHILNFGGAGGISINHNNNIETPANQLSSVNGINFLQNAGAFTLTGGALQLLGNVTNLSSSTQTIGMDLALTSNARRFFTYGGDIVVSGALTGDITAPVPPATEPTYTARNLLKFGGGNLTLSGDTSNFTGQIRVYRGGLTLDHTTLSDTGSILLGYWSIDGFSNTTQLEIKGDLDSNRGLEAYSSAKTTLKVDGVTEFGHYKNTDSYSTFHFDLSATGSSVAFKNLQNSVFLGANGKNTVTAGGKTGFVFITLDEGADEESALDDRYIVTRMTGMTALTASGGQTHTSTSGTVDLTASKSVTSLTIAGSGEVKGAFNLTTSYILMEEGVESYLFDVARITSASVYLHQYSEEGVMTIKSALLNAGSTGSLMKSGPGKVEVTAESNSNFTGNTYIQQGELALNGAFTRTGLVDVYDGGILSGGGAIGADRVDPEAETPLSTTVVAIRQGGVLAATNDSALHITGNLTFDIDTIFEMTLDGAGTDHVIATNSITFTTDSALGLGTDLQLSLSGAPTPGGTYSLLSSDAITGTFLTINGQAFGVDGEFWLNGYQFNLMQSDTEIWITAAAAIPEPSSLALIFGAGMLGLGLHHRRRNRRMS